MKKGLAIVLSFIFLSAQAEHWVELFHSHEHIECVSAKHHLHKTNFDCDHAGLFFTSIGVFFPDAYKGFITSFFKQIQDAFVGHFFNSLLKFSKPLRGPPMLLF